MTERLVRNFRFQVVLLRSATSELGGGAVGAPDPEAARLGTGAFQECSGLEIEQDVQEYLEGGRNDGVIRRVGRAKYPNLVLKRGMFYGDDEESGANRDLWEWIQGVVAGQRPVARYDGIVEVFRTGLEPVARWTFERGLPAKIKGPELNAKSGDVAIEELHIAHEGLRLAALEG